MKRTQILKYNFLVMLVLLGTQVSAKGLEEKSKKISKTYQVSSAVELGVVNQFGKVHVNTWEKNEFKVDVEIVARGKDAARAQQLLDKIIIDISEQSAQVAFKTTFTSSMNTRSQESFEVNYTINAPSDNTLKVANKFGDTYISSRLGETNLEVSYGSLKVEDMTGKLDLELGFGSGTVGETGESEMVVKYANLTVGAAKRMEMEQQFSEVEIHSADHLKLESKYGSVGIGIVNSLDAEAQFSGLSIDELTGLLYLETSYVSDFVIGKVHKSFSGIEISGKFSNYKLHLEEGLQADLDAAFSFSDLRPTNDTIELTHRVKKDNRNEYKGTIGGGNVNKKIIVRSSYGDLSIR